jgi:hypothetical protein
MADAIWSFHRLRRERFAATALAVSTTEKQQNNPVATKERASLLKSCQMMTLFTLEFLSYLAVK